MKNYEKRFNKNLYKKIMHKLDIFACVKQDSIFTAEEINFLSEYIQYLEIKVTSSQYIDEDKKL